MSSSLFQTLKRYSIKTVSAVLFATLGATVSAVAVFIYIMDARPDLHRWHTVNLDQEYTLEKKNEIRNFDDYLSLEDRLFEQLKSEVYDVRSPLPGSQLNRYRKASLADPTHYDRNWNRSFVMMPEHAIGGVLLLHGLSDSPYSIRSLATDLYEQGYFIVGLRMPGHGTVPSALVHASWQDMASAVKLAVRYVSENIEQPQPLYIVGYSMGAAQAVNYSLDSLQDEQLPRVDAMALISPAIGVSAIAELAIWQSRISVLTGLEKLAWNTIGPEYDPYKYNSFAVNAGDLMYRLTVEIDRKIDGLYEQGLTKSFPKTLAIMSLVDATVSTNAVVTHLFDKLENIGNELVLYDVNRKKDFILFMKYDPVVEYRELLQRSQLNFGLTYITNKRDASAPLVAYHFSHGDDRETAAQTDMVWPEYVYSLSHVALPFPPSDTLYGSEPAAGNGLHIGLMETKGERGVLNIKASEMLRLRYNPFYTNMQQQIMSFIADTERSDD